MDKKAFITLEFDKIRAKLASYTQNERVRERIAALEPTDSLPEAEALLAETSEAVGVILRRGNPPGLLTTDITPALMRVERGGVMNPREFLAVCNVLKVARSVKRYVSDDKILGDGILIGLVDSITPLHEVETRIDDTILSEDEIADSASSELYNIRRKMKALNGKIRDTLNSIIASSANQKALQEPIITMRGERYVVPVKAECKGQIKGIVHDSSSSGATLFIEPMAVVQITNELADLSGKEKEEIDRILAELSAYVGEFQELILTNLSAIYNLDFIFCKAKLSIEQNAMAPKLNDKGYIHIKKGRHPLLEPKKVVPIDIWLGGEFDTLVITGPNTGGKTVSLKTLGLFTLMAQSGLHINVADDSQIAVFSDVFADIGDEQSIEQSLSTFSSHIVNLVSILNRVNDRSLVLADELGAGTDPTEGAALAISILEYIRARGARAAATTHYSELKLYALSTPGVENASCEFDISTLSPTYKLLIGVPGKSNAFAISKRLGLQEEIIERAKKRMNDENIKLEDVIVKLEANRQRAEAEKEQAEALARDARVLKENMRRERDSMDQKRKKLMDEARMEALRIIESAKEESQKVLKEMRTIRDSAAFRDAQAKAEEARAKLKAQSEKIGKAGGRQPVRRGSRPKNLKLGDEVLIASMDQRATVLTLPDKNGNLQVQAGIMKIKVKLSDLIGVQQEPAAVKPTVRTTTGVTRSKSTNAAMEIDVRGKTLDEAVSVVDKFLDDSAMASLHTVTIIHGKGTGVLRQGIGNYLRRHPLVEEYRLGKYGEGENGVTVVTLK